MGVVKFCKMETVRLMKKRFWVVEQQITKEKLIWIRYLLQPLLPPDHDGERLASLLSWFRTLSQTNDSHLLSIAYLVWALHCVSGREEAFQLAQYLSNAQGWESSNPANDRLLMRKRIIELDSKLNSDQFSDVVELVIDNGAGNPADFPPTDEGRKRFYAWLETKEIIQPGSLCSLTEFVELVAPDIPEVLLSDLKPQPTPLFDGSIGLQTPPLSSEIVKVVTAKMQILLKHKYGYQQPNTSGRQWIDCTDYITFERHDGRRTYYYDVFPKEMECGDFRLLISGPSKCGKTELLRKMSSDWAQGKCLKNVNVLLLVSVCKLLDQSETPGLRDILRVHFATELLDSFVEVMEHVNGRGFCFVVDGLDDYFGLGDEGDYVSQLIHGSLSRLSEASVIVTFRSNFSGAQQLQQKLKKNGKWMSFEMVGLEFRSCILDNYLGKRDKGVELLRHLNLNLNLMGMCHFPHHLAKIIHVHRHCKPSSLPDRESEIYKQCMTCLVYGCHSREECVAGEAEIRDASNPLSCQLFMSICQLALETATQFQHILKFTARDVRRLAITHDEITAIKKNGLGIVDSYTQRSENGVRRVFSFQDLSVQKFLGAYYLSCQSESVQIHSLERHGDRRDMHELWRFFCGLVRSRHSHLCCFEKLVSVNSDLKATIRCAFESKTSGKECLEMVFAARGSLDVSSSHLEYIDCSAVGYVIARGPELLQELCLSNSRVRCKGIAALDQVPSPSLANTEEDKNFLEKVPSLLRFLSNCSTYEPIGTKGLRLLLPGLKKCTRLKRLELIGCNLDENAGEFLSLLLLHLPELNILLLDRNFLGNKGIEDLQPGLVEAVHLEELSLVQNSITVIRKLADFMTTSQYLRRISLLGNCLTNESHRILDMAVSARTERRLAEVECLLELPSSASF